MPFVLADAKGKEKNDTKKGSKVEEHKTLSKDVAGSAKSDFKIKTFDDAVLWMKYRRRLECKFFYL